MRRPRKTCTRLQGPNNPQVSHFPIKCFPIFQWVNLCVNMTVKVWGTLPWGWNNSDAQNKTDKCMKLAVFWVVAPCRPVWGYRRFRGLYCLHHQGDDSSPWEPQIVIAECLPGINHISIMRISNFLQLTVSLFQASPSLMSTFLIIRIFISRLHTLFVPSVTFTEEAISHGLHNCQETRLFFPSC
jgi:hypothetical protein